MRRFTAATNDKRCMWTVALRGGGTNDVAQCMRAKSIGDLCKQHAKMADRWPADDKTPVEVNTTTQHTKE